MLVSVRCWRQVSSPTLPVVPIRGHLDSSRRFMRDVYIGWGWRKRGLTKTVFGKHYEVAPHGRDEAIAKFKAHLRSDPRLLSLLWTLFCLRLVCHCLEKPCCNADVLIGEFKGLCSSSNDRLTPGSAPPSSEKLKYLSRLRDEPESDEGSSADEGAPAKGLLWSWFTTARRRRTYEARVCDGQAVASPGRWPVSDRRY